MSRPTFVAPGALGLALLLSALLGIQLGLPGGARAQDEGLEEESPEEESPEEESPEEESPELLPGMGLPNETLGHQASVWGEIGLFSGGGPSASANAALLEAGFRLRVSESVVVDASWGILMGEMSVQGTFFSAAEPDLPMPYQGQEFRVEPGNPTFRFLFGDRIDSVRYQIGLGTVAPLSARTDPSGESTPEEVASARAASIHAHRVQLIMTGYVDPWRWLPERAALFLPARVALELDEVAIALDTALAFLFPILGDHNAAIDTVLQGALDMAGIFGESARGGLRLSVTGGVTGVSLPSAQVALQPYLRLAPSADTFVMVRANLQLTSPPDGHEPGSGIWGLFVSGGGGF